MTKKIDYFLLTIIFGLTILGILILASASAPYSQIRFNNSYYFLKRQIIFGLIPGLVLGFLFFKLKLSFIKKSAFFLFLINLAFLLMVFIPSIGLKIEGATRWIRIGPVSFQPSEFLKITFILYLASWLASRTRKSNLNKKNKKNLVFDQTFIFFLAISAIISLALVLQPDVSTLMVIFSVAFLMYFSINTPIIHSLLVFVLGGAGLAFLIKFAPYRFNRFLVFLNPEYDPMGIGYQLKQAVIAIGSGGLSGTGLGMSVQKFFPGFLPQPISDSIFVIYSEETGFLGAFVLILLFLLFLWQGFKIIKETKDCFCQLTALGVVSWITIQAFVNIGAMIRILPLTGIPLPFVSYGGSALAATLIAMGILLNISGQNKNIS
jgi:cell division protein FtsW